MLIGAERQGGHPFAQAFKKFLIHLVFRQPEGKHGNLMGKVIYFNAVKLVDGNIGHGQQSGHAFQHLHFQPAHFFVRHNQEVA